MKITQLAELLQRRHLTIDSSMAPEHPCTLYKGPTPAPAASSTPPWSLHDQSTLRNNQDSRQALRKHVRMLVNSVGRDWVKAIAASEVHRNASNNTFNSNANDADAEQTGGEGGGGGSRKSAPSTRGRGKSGLGMGGSSKGVKRKTNDDEDENSEGGDGGNDRSVPQKKTKTSGAKQSRRKRSDKESEPQQQDQETRQRTSDLVDEILQSNDPDLKNASRIAKILKDVKLSRFAKPPPEATQTEIPLGTLPSRPSKTGRDVQAHSRSNNLIGGYWTFKFRDGAQVAESANTKVQHSMLARDAPEEELAELQSQLEKQYNSWPWSLDDLTEPLKQMLLLAAVQTIWAKPLELDAVTCKSNLTYQIQVHYIDASTGRREDIRVSATGTDSAMANIIVPPLPVFHVRKKQQLTTSSPDNPFHIAPPANMTLSKGLSTSERARHRAEDALYWIASQLQGVIATTQRVTELMNMYRQQIGFAKNKMAKFGLYGGESDLYYVWHSSHTLETRVDPPKRIIDDLGLKKLDVSLRIYSLNASRATPVLETIVQLFCAGFDIRHVWIEASKIADYVNMDIRDGVAPSSQCDCDDTQVSTELHACEACARPTICGTRAYDSLGRLVDARCFARDQIRSSPARNAGDTLAAYLAYRSLWRNFQKECVIRKFDPTGQNVKSIFDAAFAEIKKRLPGGGRESQIPEGQKSTQFTDEWSKKTFDVGEERPLIGNNPSRRRYIPHGITIDTIHRQGHPGERGLKHSRKNTAISTNACNMAHGSFNPGTMHEIGSFKQTPLEAQRSDQARKALVDALTEMAKVDCKRPYIVAGTGSDLDKYNKIQAETIAGRTTPNEPGPWDSQARQYASRNVEPYRADRVNIWSKEKWSRMQKCARSTEVFFGVDLYRLHDNTIWFGAEYTNPINFDRNGVANLLRERQRRMRVLCNKKWTTVDTDETLYQEIIFQQCCTMTVKPELQWLKQKYGDRLGLPLVCFKYSPLRFSVAHRLHGKGMLTAWNPDGPLDVSERIDNDAANNMLIESWYVNSAKSDMAEEYYTQLDEILLSVNIDNKAIYNPGVFATVGGAVVTAEEYTHVDEYEGAGFDDPENEKEKEKANDDMDIDGSNNNAGVESAAGLSKPVDLPEIFSQEIAELYQTIFNDGGLRDQLMTDAGLQRLLGRLRQIADDVTNPKAMDLFSETMAQVHREYMDTGVDSDDMLE